MRAVKPVTMMLLMAAGALAAASSCGVQIHPIAEPLIGGDFGTGGTSDMGSGGAGSPDGFGGGAVISPDAGSAGSGGRSGAGGAVMGSGGKSGGGGDGMSGAAGSPGSSGTMVNIGGTMVPKEKVIAFIHFGHSNMAGRGEAPDSLRPYFFTVTGSDVDKRSWMYHTTGPHAGFQPAQEPFTAGDLISLNSNPSTGGPGLPLVKEAAKTAPGYYFVSLGFGQNAAYCRNYLPGTSFYTAATAAALQLKGKVTFGGIFVMLGITERHDSSNINNYPSCINTIITQIRKDIGEPDLPLLLTDYEMHANASNGEDLSPTSAFGRQIIPIIHKVPTVVSRSALVPTDNCTNLVDNHHFQLDSQQTWALNALKIMKDSGWSPWATQ